MSEAKTRQKILVIEDDQALSEMLKTYFTMQGYKVFTSAWGAQGVKQASEETPDLILLDVRLPDFDGFEVRERLQASHVTRDIPVIFLTERSERVDKLKGLSLGVVDYITKPFDIQEVRLRVRNTLRRVQELTEENPITGLLEGNAVLSKLTELKGEQIVAITYQNMNTYRELYGFVASDDVMRVTAVTLRKAFTSSPDETPFIGHLSDVILFVTLPPKHIKHFLSVVDKRLARHLSHFYPSDNQNKEKNADDRLKMSISLLDPASGTYKTTEDFIAGLKKTVKAVYRA